MLILVLIDVFSIIRKIFEYIGEDTIYRNPTYLYDLFGVIFISKKIFIIEDINNDSLTLSCPSDIANILVNINYELLDLKNNKDVSPELISYERNHRVHSTSKPERESRIKYLIKRGLIK